MNLRVNLMLPEEHQGTDKAAKKILLRTGIIAASCLVAALVFHFVVTSQRDKKRRAALITRLEKVTPITKMLNEVQAEINALQRSRNELDLIQQTGTRWAPLLSEFQQSVPETLQITKLQARGPLHFYWEIGDQTIGRERSYELTVWGVAVGPDGSERVTEFVRRLPRTPEFAQKVALDGVSLESLQVDTSGEYERETRIFNMRVRFMEQKGS